MTRLQRMKRGTVHVSEAHRRLLTAWIRAGTTPQRVARRARIVLLSADGKSVRAITAMLHVSPRTVMLWQRRYHETGPTTLWRDAPGRGRKPGIPADAASQVQALLATTPSGGGRWTIRRLAKVTGLSRASVHRIVRASEPEATAESSSRKRRRQTFAHAVATPDIPL
jgi:transposase